VERDVEERAAAEATAAAAKDMEERAAAEATAAAAKRAEEEAAAAKRDLEERAAAEAAAKKVEQVLDAVVRDVEERAAGEAAVAGKQATEEEEADARRDAEERAAAEAAAAAKQDEVEHGVNEHDGAKAEVEPSRQAPADAPAATEVREEQVGAARVSNGQHLSIEVTLDMNFQTAMDSQAAFSAELVQDLARALGGSTEKIKVVGMRAGSVIVVVKLEDGLFNKDTDLMAALEMLIKQVDDSTSVLKQGHHTRNVIAIRLVDDQHTAEVSSSPASQDKEDSVLMATSEDTAKAATCSPLLLPAQDLEQLTEAEQKAQEFKKTKREQKRKEKVIGRTRSRSSLLEDPPEQQEVESKGRPIVVQKTPSEEAYQDLDKLEELKGDERENFEDDEPEGDYTPEELDAMKEKVWRWLREIPHHSEFAQFAHNTFAQSMSKKFTQAEISPELVPAEPEATEAPESQPSSSKHWQKIRTDALRTMKVKMEKDHIQDEPWIEQLRNESIEFVHTLEGHLQDEDTFADDFVAASDKYGLLACVDCVCVPASLYAYVCAHYT